MVIIEASNINFGGSFSLLKDLLHYCNVTHTHAIVYITYDAIFRELVALRYENITLIKTSNFKTILRYLQRGRENVLYFCSLPPFVKNKNSYVYFHSEYYATKPFSGISALAKGEIIRKLLYFPWIKLCKRNCDVFYCQTKHIHKLLSLTYGIDAEVRPFYKDIKLPSIIPIKNRKYDFIYPALASKHKNHLLLLQSIEAARKECEFSFILTIPATNTLVSIIDSINKKFPNTILNWGLLPHDQVLNLMAQTKCLFFPSTMESLGIPLIEAQRCGALVAASNFEYAQTSVSNAILFDPYSIESMKSTIVEILNRKYDNIKQSILIEDSKKYIIDKLCK